MSSRHLSGVPNLNVPVVGAGAQPQQQAIIVDTFDPQGKPIKALYPAVAVGVISDQVLGQLVQSIVGTALFELERRGAIPGNADRAVIAIAKIKAAIAEFGEDLPTCAKVVGAILDEYDAGEQQPEAPPAEEQPAESAAQ